MSIAIFQSTFHTSVVIGVKRHHLLEAIGREFLPSVPQVLETGGGSPAQAHEHETERDIHPHRAQTMGGAVEAGKALAHRHADQAAVLAIAPAMIGTGDGGRTIARPVEQAGAAMAAHIVERSDRSRPDRVSTRTLSGPRSKVW